ncbi:hypothetical protein TcasGA2_TC016134 [Tribolium castaneum]|uniref:ATP-dependent DNA helicase n=1 Tax=Tribolium castaneum TaxID=7070 RepID=D7ELD7_TRICA|nr:hypothetical protein TcasGA2_TC016134 [Tribolium castaneum]
MEDSQASQYIKKRNWRRQNRNAHLSDDDRRLHRQSSSVDGENVPVVCLTRDPHVEERVRTFIDTTMFLRQPIVRVFKDPYVETRVQSYLENTSSFSVAAAATTTTTSKATLPDLNIAAAATNTLPRRRHAVVPHKRTYKFALQTQNVENVPKYNIGTLSQICPHCGAKFFTLEKPKCDREGSRFACCNFGKVNLPQLAPCPDELNHLLTSDEASSIQYRENIRSANNLFAMASFKAKIPQDRNIGQGPWCFNICGQIYHYTEPLPFPNNEDPILSSYYFIEAEDAIERRANFVGDRINRETITVLENMLRQYNPWVRSYKTIKEVINDLRQEWQRRGGGNNNDEDPVQNVIAAFKLNINDDLRQHGIPTSRSDVAAVFDGEDPPFDVDLILYSRDKGVRHELKNLNRLSDPMVYPLLFPHGETGYDKNLQHTYERPGHHHSNLPPPRDEDNENNDFENADGDEVMGDRQRKGVSFREFYRYRLQIRNPFSILHHSGKLFQQYIVDAWVKCEANNLWWIKQNQLSLRVSDYTALQRYLTAKAANANVRVGNVVILPKGFLNGPRDRNRKYLDAMTIVARHGRPDLFITFTCNPHWTEITTNLDGKQQWQHRPDLVCRVFASKLAELIDDITNKQYFGVPLNYMYVIEFQKRGLPHAHILLTLRPEDKLLTEQDVDSAVSARIPNPQQEPQMYELIKRHFIHRPCGGVEHANAACIIDGRCSKGYPKAFRESTVLLGNNRIRQPEYKRPNDGTIIEFNDSAVIDNRRIVPHNKVLAAKYDCHLNVEICGTIINIKYLHKYITKGNDHVSLATQELREQGVLNWNEVDQYESYRYVSAPESIWRLFEFPLSSRSHAVLVLPVHLPNEQYITFDENNDIEQIQNVAKRPTKLMSWFTLNSTMPEARQYKYSEIPEYFTWDNKNSLWKPRKKISKMIGTLAEVSMTEGERYYLRLLLNLKRGVTSFEDLRTLNGIVYPNYQSVCKALRLLEDPQLYEDTMREAIATKSAFQIRNLFALICVIMTTEINDVSEIRNLYDMFKMEMMDDYISKEGNPLHLAELRLLNHLKQYFSRMTLYPPVSLQTFNLPDVDSHHIMNLINNFNNSVVAATANVSNTVLTKNEAENLVRTLNLDQLKIYNKIIETIVNHDKKKTKEEHHLFYIDGPGGTGKTYLYNIILRIVKDILKKNYLAVAWTGIAATLLLQGRTVHSTFRLPLRLTKVSKAGFPLGTLQAEQIRNTILIVWDEAPMTPKNAVLAVDRYLRDLMNNNVPMGGKVVVFGGDFRQLLPVLPGAHVNEICMETIKNLPFWNSIKQFSLKTNMRAKTVTDTCMPGYSEFLLKVGDGRIPYVKMPTSCFNASHNLIEIPQQFLINTKNALIEHVFGSVIQPDDNISQKAILCPTNNAVREINTILLERLIGEERNYYSIDTYDAAPDDQLHIPTDLLNSIDTSSLPPHILTLKVGAIVMLLRNIDIEAGLCNGTRLKVISLHETFIQVELLNQNKNAAAADATNITTTDDDNKYQLFLPMVKTNALEGTNLPKTMSRKQIPVKLAFAMTINKAQGQTFKKVGIYLDQPCFSHGQLYVALSRVGIAENIKIFINNTTRHGKFNYRNNRQFTSNVVFTKILPQHDDENHIANSSSSSSGGSAGGNNNTIEPYNLPEISQQHHQQEDYNNTTTMMEQVQEEIEVDEQEILDDDVDYENQDFPMIKSNIPNFSISQLRDRISNSQQPGTSGLYFQTSFNNQSLAIPIDVIKGKRKLPQMPSSTTIISTTDKPSTQDLLDEDVDYDNHQLPKRKVCLPNISRNQLFERISTTQKAGTSGVNIMPFHSNKRNIM